MLRIRNKYRVVVANRKDRYLEVLKDVPYSDEQKKQVVDHIVKLLEREDRIMWYLRRARAADLAEIVLSDQQHLEQYRGHLKNEGMQKLLEGKEQAKKRLERIVNAPADSPKWKERVEEIFKEGQKLAGVVQDIFRIIQDAKAKGFESVLSFQFNPTSTSEQIVSEMRRRYQDEVNKQPSPRLLKPAPGEKELIKFPDGWIWFLLDRAQCVREAGAMEHCGNSAFRDGDRILSLREPVEVKEERRKTKFYKPHLTFIINDGTLGEMKGFRNSKPKAEYHKYIIQLLEHDLVKVVRGGGYAAHNNFALTDLPQSQYRALLRKKPGLDKQHDPTEPESDDEDVGDHGEEE